MFCGSLRVTLLKIRNRLKSGKGTHLSLFIWTSDDFILVRLLERTINGFNCNCLSKIIILYEHLLQLWSYFYDSVVLSQNFQGFLSFYYLHILQGRWFYGFYALKSRVFDIYLYPHFKDQDRTNISSEYDIFKIWNSLTLLELF